MEGKVSPISRKASFIILQTIFLRFELMSDIKHISLQFKCNESWDAMIPCDGGRHCKVCDKKVVDFSGSSMEEFQSFVQQEGGKLCGRFATSQTVYANKSNIKFRSKWFAAFLLLFGFSACDDMEYEENSINYYNEEEGRHQVVFGKPIQPLNEENDSTKSLLSSIKTRFRRNKNTNTSQDSYSSKKNLTSKHSDDIVLGMFSNPMPRYLHGGDEGMSNFIHDNLKISDSVGGHIVVSFIVDTTGKVQDSKIIRTFKPAFDSSVLHVVNQLEFEKIQKPFYYTLPIIVDSEE